MKHTPGPWYIDPIKVHANGNRRIMAEQCTPVAVVPEHLAADARLIAAAPDLLEALKEATTALEWRWERIANRAEPVHETSIQEAYNKARAAIAKATGGEA
jgi:hypothetical protein